MDKYTGKRLDSRYEIQELIGVGGMAMVYKAYDSVDDKTVAIKILKDEFLDNSEFIRRFKNESKAIAVLSHPNIVKVYDVSFGDKIQYIVMEYIDGITLKEYISHQHIIPWKEAVHFTVQILQALQHAHEKGIVHRDMKPQNIMLLQDGTIKVTDFGIARFFNNETRTMTDKAIGSVHYIAPEQARGDSTDGKADIYSVGVMLYEMLTGELPFEAESAVSVAIMQMQNDPRPLREINDKIPEGIEEITLKAMRKDPNQRYASAREMLEAIEIFRHNPAVKFRYSYFVDETPTKLVDSMNHVPAAVPEQVYDDRYDNYDDENEGSGSKTVFKLITVLVSLMVIAAIGVIVYLTVNARIEASKAKDVDVPQFVGQTFNRQKLEKDYEFKFETSVKYDDSQPVNVILSQDPEAGSKKIKNDGVIKLVINSESATKEVPNVRNYTEQQAEKMLRDRFFEVNIVRVNSADDSRKGYVIGCSPQEGTQQEIGTAITLIVSDGVATEKEKVPDVSGMTFEAAEREITSSGFTCQKLVVASDVEEGKVITTDPLPGNYLTKGFLITVRVSDGSKIIKELVGTVRLPADEYAEVEYSVIIDGNSTPVEKKTIIPATLGEIELAVGPEGAKNNQKTVAVMLDGGLYQRFNFDFKKKTVTETYFNSGYKIKDNGAKLKEARDNAKKEINEFLHPEEDLHLEENIKKAKEVIEKCLQDIDKASSEEEIRKILDEAEAELDKIYYDDPLDESPVQNSDEKPESSENEELAGVKNDAVSEVRNYALQYYYTDENYDKVEAILGSYEEQINAAKTEGEVFSLIAEAKSEVDAIPKLDSNPGEENH